MLSDHQLLLSPSSFADEITSLSWAPKESSHSSAFLAATSRAGSVSVFEVAFHHEMTTGSNNNSNTSSAPTTAKSSAFERDHFLYPNSNPKQLVSRLVTTIHTPSLPSSFPSSQVNSACLTSDARCFFGGGCCNVWMAHVVRGGGGGGCEKIGEHSAPVTGVGVLTRGCVAGTVVSASLDGTAKFWDLRISSSSSTSSSSSSRCCCCVHRISLLPPQQGNSAMMSTQQQRHQQPAAAEPITAMDVAGPAVAFMSSRSVAVFDTRLMSSSSSLPPPLRYISRPAFNNDESNNNVGDDDGFTTTTTTQQQQNESTTGRIISNINNTQPFNHCIALDRESGTRVACGTADGHIWKSDFVTSSPNCFPNNNNNNNPSMFSSTSSLLPVYVRRSSSSSVAGSSSALTKTNAAVNSILLHGNTVITASSSGSMNFFKVVASPPPSSSCSSSQAQSPFSVNNNNNNNNNHNYYSSAHTVFTRFIPQTPAPIPEENLHHHLMVPGGSGLTNNNSNSQRAITAMSLSDDHRMLAYATMTNDPTAPALFVKIIEGSLPGCDLSHHAQRDIFASENYHSRDDKDYPATTSSLQLCSGNRRLRQDLDDDHHDDDDDEEEEKENNFLLAGSSHAFRQQQRQAVLSQRQTNSSSSNSMLRRGGGNGNVFNTTTQQNCFSSSLSRPQNSAADAAAVWSSSPQGQSRNYRNVFMDLSPIHPSHQQRYSRGDDNDQNNSNKQQNSSSSSSVHGLFLTPASRL